MGMREDGAQLSEPLGARRDPRGEIEHRPQRTLIAPRLRPPTPAGGFTLLETLLALTLLGLALLLALPLLLEQPRILHRLDTHHRALAAMESSLEALRAGALPLHSAQLPELEGIALHLEVEPASPPGLYAVTLRATYQVGAQPRERRLQTLIWRPGPDEQEEP